MLTSLDAARRSPHALEAGTESRRCRLQIGRGSQLYQVRNVLRAGAEKLSERQIIRLNAGLEAGDPNYEVTIAWQCYQKLRAAFSAKDLHRGRRIAIEVLDSFHTCPIPRSHGSDEHCVPGGNNCSPLRHRPREQLSGTEAIQRDHRATPPHRPRLPQPGQLPTV
ncbi:hypothetical protein [Jatrophihabitans lederbergiae]|uniref:Uncharacterized protein n=1 Tax=Jatrophihabitans lederbergiae TaxID=3075547 RepID=A0ABU2JC77_9ACTN|nr:hypothetical protein [Jatrophihabitans sp. DSM 44399]MDT0262591.1 hypothetical protein [Jatrophihabitans sp. DSM 44399]